MSETLSFIWPVSGLTLKAKIYSPAGVKREATDIALTEIGTTGIYVGTSTLIRSGDLGAVYDDANPTVNIGGGEFMPKVLVPNYALGDELVDNGGFDSEIFKWEGETLTWEGETVYWTDFGAWKSFSTEPGNVWALISGKAVLIGSPSYSRFYQALPADTFIAGKTFRITYTLSASSFSVGAAIAANFGTYGEQTGTWRMADGTFTEDIFISADISNSNFGFYLVLVPGDTVTIDNVSVKEITTDTRINVSSILTALNRVVTVADDRKSAITAVVQKGI